MRKAVTWSLAAVGVLSLALLVSSVGVKAENAAAEAAGWLTSVQSQGPVALSAPVSVDPTTLPQAMPGEGVSRVVRRPMNGWSDAEWYTRERYAGQRRPVGPSEPVMTPPTAGLPGGITLDLGEDAGESGIETPTSSKSFNGLGVNGWFPADMGLAVGPTYIVQAVNSMITVLNKSGAVQTGWPKTLNVFYGDVGESVDFDPRCIYDWVKNRYVCVVAQFTPTQGYIHLAVSKTSNPASGGWWLYKNITFLAGGYTCTLPDFPLLGQDREGIYLSVNRFNCATGAFIDASVTAFRKTHIYAGAATTNFYFYGFSASHPLDGEFNRVDTIQPANVQSKYDSPRAEFFLNSFNINFGGGGTSQCFRGCRGLVVWAMSNPFGFQSGGPGPQMSGVVVDTPSIYYLSLGGHQPPSPSGCYDIDTGDSRLPGSVVYQSGHLYGAVTTAVLNSGACEQVGIYAYDVGNLVLSDNTAPCAGAYQNKCPSITGAAVLQQIGLGTGGWAGGGGSAYFGTLNPTLENDLMMVYNFSQAITAGGGSYPGTAFTMRRVNYTPNSWHDSGVWLQPGLAFYSVGSTPRRWGDYTATAHDDPAGTTQYIWFSGMYSTAGAWNTRIGRVGYTNVNQP